ncbi:MAG: type II secretion system F family protein [Methanospirillum sp.]|uniref:type II secretion system F family protein n=1 Tax=Methanospirillum sp. TaxID=45200 RepID=UPI00236C1656|nr:type II secretion system F family protein [Methanospirillum sp.]MDD1728234.1 type II secretion system F family protein [Methanospirillum sp.]
MNSYERFCFNLLGSRMLAKRDKYFDLIANLRSARMGITFEAYLATAMVTSAIVGVVGSILVALLVYLLNIPALITFKGNIPRDIASGINQFSVYSLVAGTLIAGIVSFIVFGGFTYLTYLIYPSIVAGSRRRDIESSLPYAINYLAAMSTAGIPPAEVFRQLGNSTIYGESSVEARYVTLEIDVFGKDLIEALKNVSMATPSPRMREFMQGAIGSVASGSNISEYFKTKAEQYTFENRQTQKQFLDTLALISESYVTALVAGTLFLILIQSVMSILSGEGTPFFLYIIIYLIIPFGSIMFVVMIDAMTPEW